MQKLKIFFLSLILIFAISTGVSAEYFSDVIVTSPNGIWTDARSYSTLNAAITAVGANQRTVVIASPQTVTNLTVPANVTLKFERDGAINNSGQLTINTKSIIADDHQIFTGLGDIDFAAGVSVKLSWFHNLWNALTMTSDDHVTLIINKAINATASCAVGNDVILKWEAANIISANAGVTISNISQIEAGNYQILAGAGNFRFLDGSVLNLKWFPYLRTALTWINTNNVTLVVNESSDVDYSDAVPINIQLKVVEGGALDISPGITLTLADSKQMDIGSYLSDPFTGTGSVTITGGFTYTPATTLTAAVLQGLSINPIITNNSYEVDALMTYGEGINYTDTVLMAACTAVGANSSTILVRPGTWTQTVDRDYTAVCPNAIFRLPNGVFIDNGGHTLTIRNIDAGDYQIFSGTGTVTGLKYINAKWWGATGDGTTDDTIALQAALNAITDYSSFTLPSGIYNITSKLTLDGSTGDIRMIDFTFEGGAYILATGCGGLELTSVRDSKFNRVAIHRAVLDWTTNDSGLKLIHCSHNNIDIAYIGNFYNNLHIYATSAGGHYNYFKLGRIDNGHYGVMYEVDGTGSANTNTFIGGRIGLDSSVKTATAAYAATSYGFYQSSVGSYSYNLRIYGTTFETLHNGLYLYGGSAIIDSPYIEGITGYWFAGRSVGGIFRIGRWYNSSGTISGYDASKIGFDTNSTKNVWEGLFNGLDTVSIATETEGGYGWINKYSRDVDFELYTQVTTNSLRLKDPSGQIQVFDKQHTSGASPTSGTYYKGAVVWNSAISLGNTIGWMCTTTGTMGTLSGVTATGTSGEATIIVNDASGLYTGARITIAGVSGSKIIYGVSGTTVYLTTAIDASVTNAAVAYSAAVFYPILAQVAYRSGSASPSGSLTPYYVGEEYLDTSADKWYKSTGTGNTDWAALN